MQEVLCCGQRGLCLLGECSTGGKLMRRKLWLFVDSRHVASISTLAIICDLVDADSCAFGDFAPDPGGDRRLFARCAGPRRALPKGGPS